MECEILFKFENHTFSSITASMILGVYWYYQFPEHLYHFSFFHFFKGIGGHANNPAELEAKVSVDDADRFLEKLEHLKSEFKNTYLFCKINGNQLMITMGDYCLFDYHFEFILEIEKLLILENAVSLGSKFPFEVQLTKKFNPEAEKFQTLEHRFIQLTGSDFKKDNAENFSMRIDCNLPLEDKISFISDLIQICNEEYLAVFYYNDFDFKNHCNLMLIFTNGRQKKGQIQSVDINSFGNKVRHLTQKYPLHFGHLESPKYYPLQGPHIELMVDEEYIIKR